MCSIPHIALGAIAGEEAPMNVVVCARSPKAAIVSDDIVYKVLTQVLLSKIWSR